MYEFIAPPCARTVRNTNRQRRYANRRRADARANFS